MGLYMRRIAYDKDSSWICSCTLACSHCHAARRGISQSTNRKYRWLSSPATINMCLIRQQKSHPHGWLFLCPKSRAGCV
ncbi:hypothetical protein CXP35_09460 [Komagataeibacter xylinus]|nr:hypothetical protein CXP35_09460 [Komagataeibacter xylinus]